MSHRNVCSIALRPSVVAKIPDNVNWHIASANTNLFVSALVGQYTDHTWMYSTYSFRSSFPIHILDWINTLLVPTHKTMRIVCSSVLQYACETGLHQLPFCTFYIFQNHIYFALWLDLIPYHTITVILFGFHVNPIFWTVSTVETKFPNWVGQNSIAFLHLPGRNIRLIIFKLISCNIRQRRQCKSINIESWSKFMEPCDVTVPQCVKDRKQC